MAHTLEQDCVKAIMESSVVYLRDRYIKAFSLLSIPIEGLNFDNEFQLIMNHYCEKQRYYHTAHHIEDCLRNLDSFYSWCDSPITIENYKESLKCTNSEKSAIILAIFYHDIIYDPKSGVNEELSAELCRRILTRYHALYPLQMTLEFINSVIAVIMATKHMAKPSAASTPSGNDIEVFNLALVTSIMLDIDLSVLGRELVDYEPYEAQIRLEYIHVPLFDYIAGRSKILQYFIDLATTEDLYHCEYFRQLKRSNQLTWHENAIVNMKWAIDLLQEAKSIPEHENPVPLPEPVMDPLEAMTYPEELQIIIQQQGNPSSHTVQPNKQDQVIVMEPTDDVSNPKAHECGSQPTSSSSLLDELVNLL